MNQAAKAIAIVHWSHTRLCWDFYLCPTLTSITGKTRTKLQWRPRLPLPIMGNKFVIWKIVPNHIQFTPHHQSLQPILQLLRRPIPIQHSRWWPPPHLRHRFRLNWISWNNSRTFSNVHKQKQIPRIELAPVRFVQIPRIVRVASRVKWELIGEQRPPMRFVWRTIIRIGFTFPLQPPLHSPLIRSTLTWVSPPTRYIDLVLKIVCRFSLLWWYLPTGHLYETNSSSSICDAFKYVPICTVVVD